jgi:hypothetical protein
MDYSNYDKSHLKYSEKHKSELGFFKDETGGRYKINAFVGLRAKCYSLQMRDKTTGELIDKKIAKGIGNILYIYYTFKIFYEF